MVHNCPLVSGRYSQAVFLTIGESHGCWSSLFLHPSAHVDLDAHEAILQESSEEVKRSRYSVDVAYSSRSTAPASPRTAVPAPARSSGGSRLPAHPPPPAGPPARPHCHYK